MKKVMIMAGGTGGHVFPALAVADVLRNRGVEVQWMGTAKGIESRLVPEAGITLNEIKVTGLRGNGLLGWVLAPIKLVKATYQAYNFLRKQGYDLVIGLGGFASGPGGLAAWLLTIPVIIHEQNAIPGLTNKILAKLSERVLTGFPQAFAELRKAKWVGNPVRADIEQVMEPAQRINLQPHPLKLLVLGGSLGAKSLNETVPKAIQLLSGDAVPDVRHQCGSRHVDACKKHYAESGVEAEVTDFIADMATAYEWADLVICRAGALTVAELSAAGVPALLVPYPYAVDDHQTHNAESLCEVGAAERIADQDLTPELLAETLTRHHNNRFHLLEMALAAKKIGKFKVANQIADICQEVVNG
jgi:UDP-N-acetylglucosamine--N-acetylmuramyl-(pentapeptide) pyrophosphoryl-undecaprenol N-acetylglucosamine transferase